MQKDSMLILPDTALFVSFKEEIENSNIPKFNNVDDDLSRLKVDSLQSQISSQLVSKIIQLTRELFLIDSLLLDDLNQTSLSADLVNQRNNLEDSISILEIQLDGISGVNESIKAEKIDSASYKNNSINSTRDIEAYEREINSIYIETIERGIFDFNSSHKQSIEFIAGLCPLIGGTAVFKARSLLSLYNLNFMYDDHILCDMQGIQYRKSKESTNASKNEPRLNVYPNPSNGLITIDLTGDVEGAFNLKITSITGQTILQNNNLPNKYTIDLKQMNISQGIYLVEFKNRSTNQTFRTRFVYGN